MHRDLSLSVKASFLSNEFSDIQKWSQCLYQTQAKSKLKIIIVK